MNELSLSFLFLILFVCLVLSAFFSGSETGMMALNRYRLRHQAKKGNRRAILISKLLERPDRLISVILLGNNFVNITASAIATMITMRLFGEIGVAIGAFVLTFVILIFSETSPKTLAALRPERVAYPAAPILQVILWLLYPFVWIVNVCSNAWLRVFGVNTNTDRSETLSPEELRMVVHEAGTIIPQKHLNMLLSILDLGKVSVEDVMIPRQKIEGINIDDEWEGILRQISQSRHAILPVYAGDLNHIKGTLNVRTLLQLEAREKLDKKSFLSLIKEGYFIPETTPLSKQLVEFQQKKRHIALVVDEYGDLMGLVSLEDILEEIVGEIGAPASHETQHESVVEQPDGSYLVHGSENVRDLNRLLKWHLPTTGPKTLNGLITETLEMIPVAQLCFRIAGYPMEIIKTKGNAVKIVRVMPNLRKKSKKRSSN